MRLAITATLLLLGTSIIKATQPLNCEWNGVSQPGDICILQDVVYNANSPLIFPSITPIMLLNASFIEFNETHFQQLPSEINSLTLSNGSIPKVVFDSKFLTSLEISNTKLVVFEVVPIINRQLKDLQITNSNLSSLTSNIRSLVGLQRVTLRQCELSHVDTELFADMDSLIILDLSENRLKELHIEYGVLSALAYLNVNQNQLQYISGYPNFLPMLKLVKLLENDWYCEWVMDETWSADVFVLGYEYYCGKRKSYSGLCCTPGLQKISPGGESQQENTAQEKMLSVIDRVKNENATLL